MCPPDSFEILVPTRPSRVPAFLIFWIAFCAYWSAPGWVLSALHHLNRTGSAVSLVLDQWLLQFGGRVMRTVPLTLRPGSVPWHLVRLVDSNEHAIHVY